jgi:hypothetical protein
VLETNADRIKLIVEIIEVTKKVSRYLPIIVFSYASLTVVFAVMNIVLHGLARIAQYPRHTERFPS